MSIHHVTAIAGAARCNLDFYRRVLGLRLVKKTVNFDDPGTYHLYYGDETGRPGTILTFFPWEHAAPGRVGLGETEETALRVPETAIGYWTHRLVANSVRHASPERRFGRPVLRFSDPDGMALALVGVPAAENEPAWAEDIPAEHAVRGFAGITLLLQNAEPTAAILTDVLGFGELGREGPLTRFEAQGTALGGTVDMRVATARQRGRLGAGSVHHVAFRAADDAAQAAMVRRLADHHGIRTTEQRDRKYFRSVYFREPGGVLFEIATDEPGFAADEPVPSLGRELKLPSVLEPRRRDIEAALPALA